MRSRPKYLTAGILLLTGAMIGFLSQEVGSEEVLAARSSDFDEAAELIRAQVLTPYDIRYPLTLPAGAELGRVMVADTRPTRDELDADGVGMSRSELISYTDPAQAIVAVDMYWILPSGGRLHMWQTNDPAAPTHALLETGHPAPRQGPAEISLGNGTWRRIDFYWGSDLRSSLNRLFEDAIFISIDGDVDASTLSLVAGSLL